AQSRPARSAIGALLYGADDDVAGTGSVRVDVRVSAPDIERRRFGRIEGDAADRCGVERFEVISAVGALGDAPEPTRANGLGIGRVDGDGDDIRTEAGHLHVRPRPGFRASKQAARRSRK